MTLGNMCDVNCGGTEKRNNKGKGGKRADAGKPRKTYAGKPTKSKKVKGTKGAKSKTHSGKDYTGHKGDISKSKGKDVKADNKNVDYSKMTIVDLRAEGNRRGLNQFDGDKTTKSNLKKSLIRYDNKKKDYAKMSVEDLKVIMKKLYLTKGWYFNGYSKFNKTKLLYSIMYLYDRNAKDKGDNIINSNP
jgi:hypothetical protein